MTVSRTICLGFLAVILTGAMLLMLPFSTTSGQWNDPIVSLDLLRKYQAIACCDDKYSS